MLRTECALLAQTYPVRRVQALFNSRKLGAVLKCSEWGAKTLQSARKICTARAGSRQRFERRQVTSCRLLGGMLQVVQMYQKRTRGL